MKRIALLLVSLCTLSLHGQAGQEEAEEITYGRKDGMALTMVMQPPSAPTNGKAVIWVVSAGWTSDYNYVNLFKALVRPFSERGYTLFYVMHGSQPRYTVPDAIPDVRRAVRFIRLHAEEYGIDPDQLAISGGSAGGHLSLMIGTTGDDGDPSASDPVEKVSSRVQAVACFYPPSDLLNWKSEGDNAAVKREIEAFQAPLDFVEWNQETLHYIPVTDSLARTEIGREISPYYFVTPDDPPTYIVHGDEDEIVPLYQSEKIIAKFEEAQVPCKLAIEEGAGHGIWNNLTDYVATFADWFDTHLQ